MLFHADEPDLIRHVVRCQRSKLAEIVTIEGVPGPGSKWAGIGCVDVDNADPDEVGPPELDVWVRFKDAPDDPVISQSLLAYVSEGFLTGTSTSPHRSIGVKGVNVGNATSVVSHTLTFLEPFKASEWMLLVQAVPYAGRGRIYGRADVFSREGALIASFVQDSMVRKPPQG